MIKTNNRSLLNIFNTESVYDVFGESLQFYLNFVGESALKQCKIIELEKVQGNLFKSNYTVFNLKFPF